MKTMMKTRNLLFVLIAVSLVIAGCNQAKDLANVTFDAEFKADLNCEVPPASFKSGIDGAFAASKTINPLADSTVEKYIDKIKSWEITGVTGEILSVSKEGVNLLGAELEVFSANHSTAWHIPATALFVGQKITFDNGNGQWDTIDAILGEKDVFTVSVNGSTDQDDVTFVIRLIIKTRVTVNPL